jgi:uncharacterized phage-associated protein
MEATLMAVSALSAARTLCELRNWAVSNLELQKILYIAQMFHLGQTGRPLINEKFEAWDYGPVVPELYSRAKAFGKAPVRNVFHWIPDVPFDAPEYKSLAQAANATRDMTSGQLVSVTHWSGGAWSQCYRPNERGVVIPNSMILDEYRARETA